MRARNHELELRADIAAKILSLAEDWRDDSENPDPITLQSFVACIKLTDIVMQDADNTQLFYDDDNVFLHHALLANLDSGAQIKPVSIAG